MLPSHPGRAAGTHGIRAHAPPHVPCPQAACCPPRLSPVLLQTHAALPSVSFLHGKTRGKARARRVPLSSLCSVWRSRSGDLYLISPGCCLPARGCEGLV